VDWYFHSYSSMGITSWCSRCTNEYYGKGKFNLIPMLGGLFMMEAKFGAKWRKHIPGGSKFIGRIKANMGAIDSMAGTDGGSVERGGSD
jgi:hypothetical protein